MSSRPADVAVDVDALILELWQTARSGSVFASKALESAFAAHPGLSGAERQRIARTVYGLLGHARRIEYALAPFSAGEKHAPAAHLMAYQVLEGDVSARQAARRMPPIDWVALANADRVLCDDPDPMKRIGVRFSLPDFLTQCLLDDYGEEAEAVAGALNDRAPLMLRVNTIKASREEALDALTQAGLNVRPSRFSPTGIEVVRHANVFRLPLFSDGWIEVQDEASQLVSDLTAPPVRGLTIDYCAGAGGKTLALGALMRNRGRLIALDTNARRLEELRRRARRAGLANVRAIQLLPGGEWPDEVRAFRGKADRVLVDVPCSGTGALRRKPDMRWRLQSGALDGLPEQQLAIAQQALDLCAPGGRLVYATCSLLSAENERVIEKLIEQKGLRVVPPKEILGKAATESLTDASGQYLKLLPNRHGCDGFFAAVLKRT